MTSTTIEKELLERERSYWRAIKDRDLESALKLTNDPCMVTGASGVATIDRNTFRQMMEASTYVLHDFKIDDDVQIRRVTDDVFVMGYKVTEELTVEGKRVTLKAADSSVWVRHDGAWLCAMHTESVLGDAYGRDRTAN